jgi:hypothetical protein
MAQRIHLRPQLQMGAFGDEMLMRFRQRRWARLHPGHQPRAALRFVTALNQQLIDG